MSHKINLTYDILTIQQPLVSSIIKKCIETTLAAEHVTVPCEINVLVTNDKGIHTINLASRQIDRIGYPAAYIMASSDFRTPKVMAMLFILPMWINCLLRTIATVELFNMFGLPLGEGALLFGLCYDYLPFMIYPIYNTLLKMDNSLVEAAQDLGANRWTCFWKVIVPLSMPGVYSGIVMVFMPTVSTFAIAELLTRNNIKLFGSLIQDYITTTDLLNYGAVLSLVLLVIIGITSFFGDNDTENAEKGGMV
ncbi:MAG: ABC transporter permease subunit [Bacteroidaceae bacterium]|nr:ABC transporter permease subunit [Bacteroidaceae bacterium]